MSYKYVGTRDGKEYYKRGSQYYEKKQLLDNNRVRDVYVEVKCFWDQGKVTILKDRAKYTTLVREIKPGDQILTQSGFESVLYIHLPADNLCEILRIETSSGLALGVSKHHLIYDCKGNMKQAGQFKIGEQLQTKSGSSQITKISKTTTTV